MQLPKKEFQKQYQAKEWNELRKRILERDGYRCKSCQSKRKLIVHHLKYGVNGSLMVDENNLITLCNICHDRKHNHKYKPEPKKKKVVKRKINKVGQYKGISKFILDSGYRLVNGRWVFKRNKLKFK